MSENVTYFRVESSLYIDSWKRSAFFNLQFIAFFIVGCVRSVIGEGMPHFRNPFEKGNLYIKFDITFPPNKFTEEPKLKVCGFVCLSIKYSLRFIYGRN